MKNFTASNVSFKVKWNGKTTKIRLHRDIVSYRNNAYVDVQNLFEIFCLALGNSDGTTRKTCKQMLSGTAMSELVTVDKTNLCGHDAMNMYFLDLTANVRIKPVL